MNVLPYLVALQVIAMFLFGQNTSEYQLGLCISSAVVMALYAIHYAMPRNSLLNDADHLEVQHTSEDAPATEPPSGMLAPLQKINSTASTGFMGSDLWVNYAILGIQCFIVYGALEYFNIPSILYDLMPVGAFFMAVIHSATIYEERRDPIWYFVPILMFSTSGYLALFGLSNNTDTLSYTAFSTVTLYFVWEITMHISRGVEWAAPRVLNQANTLTISKHHVQAILLSSTCLLGNCYFSIQLNESLPLIVGTSLVATAYVLQQLKIAYQLTKTPKD